ncbi:hypothetical protein F4805DRAFT_459073 [Annulohypoxylon moriforme]|nr:hypothetical protein F4805DRAFT_459073 [Annulohypoxylon moriforme]
MSDNSGPQPVLLEPPIDIPNPPGEIENKNLSAEELALVHSVTNYIHAFLAKPKEEQTAGMVTGLVAINVRIGLAGENALRTLCDSVVQKMNLFLIIPRDSERSFYLLQLREHLQDHPNADDRFEKALNFLPKFAFFVLSIRKRQYHPRRDGNWFHWWRRVQREIIPETAHLNENDELNNNESCRTVEHMIEHESIRIRASAQDQVDITMSG